jgi:hypothetical protein
MNDDQQSEASLEAILRLLDEGRLRNEETLKLSLKGRSPESLKKILVVVDAMVLFLSDDYDGKVSSAARKILANGPELTTRARGLFLRMGTEIRKQIDES